MEGEPESRTHGDHEHHAYAFEEHHVAAPFVELSTGYRVVSTEQDAQELAHVLQDPHRDKAVVVISSAKAGPLFKPDDAANRLGADADVYLLSNSAVAFDLERFMPYDCAVYGGAIRSYPPGTFWITDPWKSVLRTAYTEAEARDVLKKVVDDVDGMVPLEYQANHRAVFVPEPAAEPAKDVVHGTVSTFLEPDAALVKLDDGSVARVTLPNCWPYFDASRLLPQGMRVSGTVTDGVMDLSGRNTAAEAADRAGENTVHLALVASEKTVMLFPGLEVKHRTEERPGSVIAVLVELAGRADGKAWRLITVEDPVTAGIAQALPFVEGGEPWISWPVDEVQEPGEQPAPEEAHDEAEEAPENAGAGTSSAHEALAAIDAARHLIEATLGENERLRADVRHLTDTVETLSEEIDSIHAKPPTGPIPTVSPQTQEIARLNARIAGMHREKLEILEDQARVLGDADQLAAANAELTRVNERLREEIRTERERANRARQASQRNVDEPTGPLFVDPADQFRHEVYLEWAQRIPAGSKKDLPLAEYDLAPGFLESVEALQGIDRSKIVAVAVEVLTGLADRQPGRDMHRLRGGAAGTGYIEDAVLGTAWRVSLQIGTASARRMHFWRGTDARIVFSTVGVHDDMDI